MNRTEQIIAAVESYQQTHEQWVGNSNEDYPTLSYWRAIDRMVDIVQGGDLPADCRVLATAVYKIAEEKAKFDLSEALMPDASLWAAKENLDEAMRKQRMSPDGRRIESIAELNRQNVPHEQIARMWGLVNADGHGKSWLVQQELDRPGSVINESYVIPADREAAREFELQRARFAAANQELQKTMEQRQDDEDDKPCPESSYELWLQAVGLPQAAKMLKRPLESVEAEWKVFQQQRDDAAKAKLLAAGISETSSQPAVGTGAIDTVYANQIPGVPLERKRGKAESGQLEVDEASEFSNWSDTEVRVHAATLGIRVTKNSKRDHLIGRIVEIERAASEGGINQDESNSPQNQEDSIEESAVLPDGEPDYDSDVPQILPSKD